MNQLKGSHKFVFDSARIGPWVCEKAGGSFTSDCTAIGLEYDGELVAGMLYDGYTGSSIAMHSRCDDPSKVIREFYWIVFDYPFNQLKVKRVTGLVCSANLRAQKIDEKLGFRREATLADYFPTGDGIVYIMRREDCRFIQGNKYGRQIISSTRA